MIRWGMDTRQSGIETKNIEIDGKDEQNKMIKSEVLTLQLSGIYTYAILRANII